MDDERDKPWNMHTCKLCPYRSKSTFIMCEHVRMHSNRPKTDTFTCDSKPLEMLRCEFCEFSTNLKVILTEHSRVFHYRKPNKELKNILKCYCCKNCYLETHSVLVLAKHADDCVSKKANVFTIKNEEWEEFGRDSVNSKPEDINWFECPSCEYKGRKRSLLRKHIMGVHVDPKVVNVFQCDQCTYKAKSKIHLKFHMMWKHTNPNNINWFECPSCEYTGRKRSSLKMHIRRMHVNPPVIKGFRCAQCTHITKTKIHLKIHMMWKHTNPNNINRFKCAYAPTQLKQNSI